MITRFLIGVVLAALLSTTSLANTIESPNTSQETNPSSIDIGPLDVIVQSVPEDKDQVSLGLTKQIGNVTYTTTTQRLITNPRYSTSITAFVIWKF